MASARTALHTNFRATRDITYTMDHSTYYGLLPMYLGRPRSK